MKKNLHPKAIRYFSLLMVFVYLGMGIVLLFTNAGTYIISENRIAIGGMIGGYGIVRLLIALQRIRRENK